MSLRTVGVELGGTKTIALLDVGGRAVERVRLTTGEPNATLAALVDQVTAWDRTAPIDALGIASFGPLRRDPRDPRFGRISATPKPLWSEVDVRGAFAKHVAAPIGFDTDVAGAALAEGRWGAALGCSDHVYITIGTGVGMGVVANGRLVHGGGHPEAGHLRVRRAAGDRFGGVCPFHGDCLEGLVSGPALAARTGIDGHEISDCHPVWNLLAAELSEAMSFLLLTLSPDRIVIGGGVVAKRPMLIPMIAERTKEALAGYLQHAYPDYAKVIVPPSLGEDAGPRGSIALALAAYDDARAMQ